MIKNLLTGTFIGIANIIPGISGGTIIVILGMFDKIMNSISNLFKKDNLKRKNDIIFLSQIMIGLLIGIIIFANIIDYLLNKWPNQTIFLFIGLIIFGIPNIIEKQIPKINNTLLSFTLPFTNKHKKNNANMSLSFLLIGFIIIISLFLLLSGSTSNTVILFPTINIIHLLKMIVLGIITGAATIFPGISGAMLLLIIGEYYLYKSYIARILTFQPNIIIPILFIGIGILIGVVGSAKVTSWLLNNYRRETMSLIIGLIIASSLVLIPFDITYDISLLITYILSFLGGGLIITTVEKIKK